LVGVVCRQACTAREQADHHAIRYQVFVQEQAVFAESDRDVHDDDEATIRLVGYCDGVAAGSVRLFELEHATGLWQGDRLAVLAPFRSSGLGAPLVRCAVATAGALGGDQMVAHVQIANVAFFTRLGWTPVGDPEMLCRLAAPANADHLAPARRGCSVRTGAGAGCLERLRPSAPGR